MTNASDSHAFHKDASRAIPSGFELIIFTDSFPFGWSEPFLETELAYLARRFDKILIIPFYSPLGAKARQVPDNVTFAVPLWPFAASGFKKLLLGLLNLSPLWPHLYEFFKNKVYRKRKTFARWAYSLLVTRYLCSHPWLREVLATNKNALLYFYWGCNSAWTIPSIRRKNQRAKIITRFHGVDLYAYRQDNANYLPLQPAVLAYSSQAVFISDDGLSYAKGAVAPATFSGQVFRLGVEDRGKSLASEDGVYRIVSCSWLVPVKRVHLIVEALAQLDFAIEWTHIGDGILRSKIEDLAGRLAPHVATCFLGKIPNNEVSAYYATTPVDLFLNVSESEGVPVSIMEALSAGIPVLATNVGGTPELVDDTVGKLLPAKTDGARLAQEITAFRMRSLRDGENIRIAARRRWAERADAAQNYDRFGMFLASLMAEKSNET